MDNIIIRKARQDYVCNVCGHIIRAGTEYLDKIITHDAKAVRHERYHDECPYSDNEAIDKFIRHFIINPNIIGVEKRTGVKVIVVGMSNWDNKLSVELLDWDYNKIPDVWLTRFIEEYNYN